MGLERFLGVCAECFVAKGGAKENSVMKLIPLVLAFVITYVLIIFVGKYLWNNCLVNVVTIAKPVTALQLLGVSILIRLLFN